ncbi:PREDICTED: uncharacterized protein At4g26450-like [Ipomoea nil]|uniref:uncharacterized protein At4g26450-like n=1 Tax=Ipomoea nil TaxID=35883 RepID=UPI0009019D78|nr:PREDICTED: uncharacterized protein At4g26450-like [Ipomoea nil]
MHARHRSPANAYNRSSSMGMGGMGTTSRVSPEGSMRSSRGMYKSYNRGGYGRGQLRQQFEPRQPSPQRSDIFMEAGRMAAEYLVSKGLLPRSALLGKLQNGSLKNHSGYSHGFRMVDGDNMQLSMEGRTSALSRLGNVADGEGPGRKRYPNDYSSMASKGYARGRRRHGSYKDSEWDQEFGRSATWSDRARASTDMDGHTNAFSGRQDEKQAIKDSNSELQNSPATELNRETDGIHKLVGDSESILNRNQSVEDTSAIDTEKDLLLSDKVDRTEKADDMEISNAEVGEVENGNDNDGMEVTAVKEDKQINLCAEKDNLTSKKGTDLLSLCRFEKVPKRIRSSLANRCPKVDANTMAEKEETQESELPKEFDAQGEDMSMHVSSDDISLHQNHDTKALDSENSKALATEEVPFVSFAVIEENTTGPSSFADHPLIKEDEESEGVNMFGRCSSEERGKKRPLEDIDNNVGVKKPRELALFDETEPEDVFVYSISMAKQQNSEDQNTTNGEPAMLSPDHKKLVDVPLFSSDVPTIEFSEKQLFPSSYKTCDLNHIDTCDVNHNCDADSVLTFPCTTDIGKQTAPVNIGLPMNENYDLPSKYSQCGFGGRDIEVIDLENDSDQDNKTFNNPQSSETGFTAQDGFPNDANDIADVQDGYGLMFSELLGSDIPNCSSVPGDLNTLHNDMGLHNGEGILGGDDDSIYMSLEEIPSFLRSWQQPSQEFGKPF